MQLLKFKNLLKYGGESTIDVIDDLDFCSKKLQVIMRIHHSLSSDAEQK